MSIAKDREVIRYQNIIEYMRGYFKQWCMLDYFEAAERAAIEKVQELRQHPHQMHREPMTGDDE